MKEQETRFEAVDHEIAKGRLWRAKELLQGRLATRSFDPDLFEKYGIVLLEMRDTLEAGRYLFASGRRAPRYEEAIELFLQRFGGKGDAVLKQALPPVLSRRDGVTSAVIGSDEFRRHGFTPELLSSLTKPEIRSTSRKDNAPSHLSILAFAILAVVAICLIVGLATIIGWAWRLIMMMFANG